MDNIRRSSLASVGVADDSSSLRRLNVAINVEVLLMEVFRQ